MDKGKNKGKELSGPRKKELFQILQMRFEQNKNRHQGIEWVAVQEKLGTADVGKLWSLNEMEETGGEPDVVHYDINAGVYIFYDCSPESPKERRSVCYDPEALASRKEHKPLHSAVGMAAEMGVELLTEKDYRWLQELGNFDNKTSSWIVTPPEIRKLGGAIFGDRRYGQTFIYHNGAESYYAARGFRASLKV